MYSWEQICGTFTADGGEKFLTIGNFSADVDTKSESIKKLKDSKVPQLPIAYYYVDDVSIVLLNPNEMCDCVVAEPRNQYSTTIYQNTIQLNDKMTATEKVEAQMVFFAFGKINFSNEGTAALNSIVEAMKADGTMRLEIQGHSDPMEDKVGAEKPQYAEMANNRVNAVYNYLVEKGVSEARLIASPQGSSVPNAEVSATDDEDLKMAKNRRVTFKVRK
jgi:outer membrane protein OmpA-like peptidoglycan-associated protein